MGSNNPTLYNNLAEINSKPSTILSVNTVEWTILRVFSSFCCVERAATFEQQYNSTGLSIYYFSLWLFSTFYFNTKHTNPISRAKARDDRCRARSVVIDLRPTP